MVQCTICENGNIKVKRVRLYSLYLNRIVTVSTHNSHQVWESVVDFQTWLQQRTWPRQFEI